MQCVYSINIHILSRFYLGAVDTLEPQSLQCVAVCCSVLQCVAVCCSVKQCVAVCCSVLQCVSVWDRHSRTPVLAVCCIVLQCVAVCCSGFPYGIATLEPQSLQ